MYVLVDFLYFVDVLFQSDVFECVLFFRCNFAIVGVRGGCYVYLQDAFVYTEKTVSGGEKRTCEGGLAISTFPLANYVKYG